MSRPVSHPAVSDYQPRFPSPLSVPPIQDRNGTPPNPDPPILSHRSPHYSHSRNVLTRSSAYSRGRRRAHGRSTSAPVVQHQPQAQLPPTNHTKLGLGPKPANPISHRPSQVEMLRARVVSGTEESRDVTDFQAHFNVATTAYPPRQLEQERPIRADKPLPPRPHSSPNRPFCQDTPTQVPTPRNSSQPHAALPLPRRPPSSVTRPRSSGSDFRSRDDDSRDLLARMAAHSRSLSSEKRYWEAVPRISAPKEVNPVQYQQPRPRSSMVVTMNRQSGLNEYVTQRAEEGDRGGSHGSGVWRYLTGVYPFRTEAVSSLSFDIDCFGGGSESTDSSNRTVSSTGGFQSHQVEDLHTRLGFRRRTNLSAHHDDEEYTPPPARSMSKLRTLRLSKLRKSRAPSITFDVPLTTIQPEPLTTSTIRSPPSTGSGSG